MMTKHYDTVIFDLDGTLLDTLCDLTDSVNYALENNGFPKRTIEEVRTFVGNGILNLIQRAVPTNTSEEAFLQTFETFKVYYATHCQIKTKAYPDILDLLSTLKEAGYKLAIVSNKADFAVKKLADLYFKELIFVAIGENPSVAKKPAPDMINTALAQLHSTASNAVYIGDSEVDIETARNAGLSEILVSWGFRDLDFLKAHGAKTIVSTVDELLAHL